MIVAERPGQSPVGIKCASARFNSASGSGFSRYIMPSKQNPALMSLRAHNLRIRTYVHFLSSFLFKFGTFSHTSRARFPRICPNFPLHFRAGGSTRLHVNTVNPDGALSRSRSDKVVATKYHLSLAGLRRRTAASRYGYSLIMVHRTMSLPIWWHA